MAARSVGRDAPEQARPADRLDDRVGLGLSAAAESAVGHLVRDPCHCHEPSDRGSLAGVYGAMGGGEAASAQHDAPEWEDPGRRWTMSEVESCADGLIGPSSSSVA